MKTERLTLKLKNIIPDECPICKYSGIQTIFGISDPISGASYLGDKQLDTMLVCDTKCEHCNLPSSYAVLMEPGRLRNAKLIVPISTETKNPMLTSKPVADLSPKFVKVLKEAIYADNTDLSEIAGMGYRKALECLVTDYCINELDILEKEAKTLPLSQLIDKIPDENIKNVAHASAWIGNDETHYFRENPDHDTEHF